MPKLLKDKVMNDISFIKLSIDIADLFVIKYPNTIASLLSSGDNENKNQSKK